MKKFLQLALLALTFTASAQEPCEHTIITSGGKEYKSTKDYVVYEKVFGTTSTFVFFSMSLPEGIPVLNFQLLAKSQEFPKAYCLDKSSRIYLQLENGKVVTLISALDENCANLIYDNESKNNIRVLSGSFLFTKGSIEELEKSPVTMMRVKYSTETVDYPVRKELTSETNNTKYFPEMYFKNHLKCLE